MSQEKISSLPAWEQFDTFLDEIEGEALDQDIFITHQTSNLPPKKSGIEKKTPDIVTQVGLVGNRFNIDGFRMVQTKIDRRARSLNAIESTEWKNIENLDAEDIFRGKTYLWKGRRIN